MRHAGNAALLSTGELTDTMTALSCRGQAEFSGTNWGILSLRKTGSHSLSQCLGPRPWLWLWSSVLWISARQWLSRGMYLKVIRDGWKTQVLVKKFFLNPFFPGCQSPGQGLQMCSGVCVPRSCPHHSHVCHTSLGI